MNYHELKETFNKACEMHQEANGNEDSPYLCSSCRYSDDGNRGECFAHYVFDIMSGDFLISDKLTEWRTQEMRQKEND
jgi:hypothetical protein